ncbi:MAG: 30S ribosomal protein S1 [Clostridia bacterium]
MKKIEIKVAKYAGFCSGVKRAVKIAQNSLKCGTIVVDGELVHNKDVISHLIDKGLTIWDGQSIEKGTKVLIKAHGTTIEQENYFTENECTLIDATCPHVKKIHKIAEEAKDKGIPLIIFGEKKHPEVKGIASRGGNNVQIVENEEELIDAIDERKETYVVCQTTANTEKWNIINGRIVEKYDNLKIFQTICPATTIRQRASIDLARQVDIMLIVGGYNSSNTRRLHELCSQTGVRAYHVENASDLDYSWFTENDLKIGVTAGASTPDWVIKEVIVQMEKNLEKDNVNVEEMKEEAEEVLEDVKEKVEEVVEEVKEEVVNEEEQEEVEETEEATEEEAETVEEVEEESTSQEDTEEDTSEEDEEDEEEDEEQPTNMEDMLDDDFASLKKGSIVNGTVVRVNDDEVLVDIGFKSEGIVTLRELTNDRTLTPSDLVEEGDEIEVFVLRVSDDNGNPVLSKRRAESIAAWNKVKESYENEEDVTGRVVEAVKGGLLVDVMGMRAFLPASLVDRNYVPDLSVFTGEDITAKVIEIDRQKRRVVLSRQAYLEEIYKKQQEETWNTLEEGQVIKGIVQRITNFGAFVDVGAVDGLVHISELSWGRVEHPSEVLNEGDEVTVKVLSVDREKERVSLSIRQVTDDPWTKVDKNYEAGEIVQGKVVRTVSFGAFVELEPGVEGLVHISQLAWNHVEKTEDVVTPGDVIKVKILSVNKDEKRISLSLKETTERPPRKEGRSSNRRKPTTGHSENASVTLGDMFGDLLNKAKKKNEEEEEVEVEVEEVTEEETEENPE